MQKNQAFTKRLQFALSGLAAAFRSEASFRFQILAATGVVFLILALRPGALWTAILLLTTSGVLSAELFNTALERLADRLHPELDPAIRSVKDCAAGAVLVLSFCSVAVFLLFAFSYLIR